MTYDEFCCAVREFKYKRGWRFSVQRNKDDSATVWVDFDTFNCNGSGDKFTASAPRVVHPELLNDNKFVVFMRNLILMCETHEADEWIVFRGVKVFDPHRDSITLAALEFAGQP